MTSNLSLLCIKDVIRLWGTDFKRWLRLKIWILRLWALIFKNLILNVLILRLESGRLRLKKKNEFCFGKFWYDCRGAYGIWFWFCHWGREYFGRGPLNPLLLPRKRPLKIPRVLPLDEFEFWPRFCEKEPLWGCCVWFFWNSSKWFVKVLFHSSNFFDISFNRLSMASWLVLNFSRAVTSLSVTEGPISLNASMTESSDLQRLWIDNRFRAKIHVFYCSIFGLLEQLCT